MNLHAALVSMYRNPWNAAKFALLTIAQPYDRFYASRSAGRLQVQWAHAGAPTSRYTVLVDENVVQTVPFALREASVDISRWPVGSQHTLRIRAEDTHCPWPLSRTNVDVLRSTPLPPAEAAVRFTIVE